MGWYNVTKTIKGIPYLYRQRSYRDGKSVRTESHLIGRADGGGRSHLTIKIYDDEVPQSIPIGVNTTRLAFHGSRQGFQGPPRPSDGGNLGPGFYLSDEDRAERFRIYSPKTAAFYHDQGLPPEYDGDLVEFDLRHLNVKHFEDRIAWLDWSDQLREEAKKADNPFESEQVLFVEMQRRLEQEGYHAAQINDPEAPEMVVFPGAIRRLRQLGSELTLHLKNTTRRGAFRTIATIPAALMNSAQKFTSKALFLSSETMEKIKKRHPDVDESAIRDIPNVLRYGEVVRDKWNRALVIFAKRKNRWWRLAIKATKKGEPFVLTYHRSDERHRRNAKRLHDRKPF